MDQDREMLSLLWNYRAAKRHLDEVSKIYDEVYVCGNIGMVPHATAARLLVEAVAAHREAEDAILQARERMKAQR